jgi:hypothetical protein
MKRITLGALLLLSMTTLSQHPTTYDTGQSISHNDNRDEDDDDDYEDDDDDDDDDDNDCPNVPITDGLYLLGMAGVIYMGRKLIK